MPDRLTTATWQVEQPGQGHAGGGVGGVRGLHAAQDQVGRLGAGKAGQHGGDGERVGARERPIPDAHRAVRALGQAGHQSLLGPLVADRHDDDLAALLGLRQLHRGLQGEGVPLVQPPGERALVQHTRSVELTLPSMLATCLTGTRIFMARLGRAEQRLLAADIG